MGASSVERIGIALGAVAQGVDLGEPCPDQQFDEIESAYKPKGVVT
jgi:hypothetical protein